MTTEHDATYAPRPERTLTGTPPATVRFRAVLTATSNPYLVDRLPVAGYVDIHEFDVHGGVQPHGAMFAPDSEDGTPAPFVVVEDARFEFGTRPVRYADQDVDTPVEPANPTAAAADAVAAFLDRRAEMQGIDHAEIASLDGDRYTLLTEHLRLLVHHVRGGAQ